VLLEAQYSRDGFHAIGRTLSVICLLFSLGDSGNRSFSAPRDKRLHRSLILRRLRRSSSSGSESVFAGFEEMSYRSLVMVSHSLLKVLLSPLLILFGLGALGAVLGPPKHPACGVCGHFIALLLLVQEAAKTG